ncbi:MAG: DUF1287 domain-containing protein [Thermoanaerobaculales bacterium]|nr:DUF1287 domain-containing protein [Thermoanaerobaculales bacterium]
MPYPGGDVPDDVGVCTDLVIRSYRPLGVDLELESRGTTDLVTGLLPRRG